jgi:CTP synthase (UTP-ammonia lyase)
MKKQLDIGIIGDFEPRRSSHLATVDAIHHAAAGLGLKARISWAPTPSILSGEGERQLKQCDCFWASPGSPYKSLSGAIQGIRLARESGRPFVGTWGGFQHTLLEYARNVAGIKEAGHAEEEPDTAVPLLILASCQVDSRPEGTPRLWGKLKIGISPDSLAFRIYQRLRVEEAFNCNYELNPLYRDKLESSGLKVSGVSEAGGARIIELPDHRFFIATGFLPQISSAENSPHPLIVAYLEAASK